MQYSTFFVFYLTLLLFACQSPQLDKQESVLAIFAHPDDETIIAPVLAKYATTGNEVYLVIATDGQFGVTNHFGMSAGDTLAAVRDLSLIHI